MSSKHEQHSIPDGKVSTSNNQKEGSLHGRASVWKWRRVLLLSLVFIILALVSMAAGKLGRALLMTGDYSQDSLESGNASMEEVTSLECCREPETAMSPSNTVECALKMFNKQSGLVSENMESGAYCSSAEVSNAYYRGLESFEDMKTSFFLNDTFSSLPSQYPNCNENKLQLRELHSHATISSEGMFVRFAKICLWILIGMAISYNLRRLYGRFRFQKHAIRQPSLQKNLQKQQVRSSSQSCGKWRKKLLVVFVFCGVITSFWLFWSLNEDIMLRRKGTLATMCEERARMLQDQFNVSMNHVHSLAILISTFHHGKQPSAIDQKTFEDYTERTAFERPLTSGVAYALRVCHFEMERIEKQYGWTIKKMDIENQTLAQDYNPESLTTSPVQDEYAPVIFSQKTVSHIVSIDMMSGKVYF